MSGFVAVPPVATYNVAKFGVIVVIETLARELRAARMAGYEPSPGESVSVEAAQPGLLAPGMGSDEAGTIMLDGVRQGRFWIFTHPQWVDGSVRDRFEAMATNGSFPDL